MQEFLLNNVFWLLLAAVSAAGLVWTFIRSGQLSVTPQAATLSVSREGGIFLDIRPSADYAGGHIARAQNIPSSDVENRLNSIHKYRDKPVVIVCQNGMKSRATAQQLMKAGFANVRVLAAGIAGWRDAQMPLTTKK